MAKNTIEINISGASGGSNRDAEIKALERQLALAQQINTEKAKTTTKGKANNTAEETKRELGLIEKEKIALKELKTARDQATDVGKQKQLTSEIERTTAKLKEQTQLSTQHKNTWGEALGSFQQKFNAIGNLVGGVVLGAVERLADGVKDFAIESFKAYESEMKQEKLLLNGLKGRVGQLDEIKKANEDMKGRFAVDEGELMSIERMAAAQGLSTEKIIKLTEASYQLAAVTGGDVDGAAKQLLGTFQGVTKGVNRWVGEVKTLTKEQLKNGDALDLVSAKYKGFAEASVTASKRAGHAWEEFKEGVGKSMVEAAEGANDSLKAIGSNTKEAGEAISTGLIGIVKNSMRVMILGVSSYLYELVYDLFNDFEGTLESWGKRVSGFFSNPLTSIKGLFISTKEEIYNVGPLMKDFFQLQVEGGALAEEQMKKTVEQMQGMIDPVTIAKYKALYQGLIDTARANTKQWDWFISGLEGNSMGVLMAKLASAQIEGDMNKVKEIIGRIKEEKKKINEGKGDKSTAQYADIIQLHIDAMEDGRAKELAIENKRYDEASKQHKLEVNGKQAQLLEDELYIKNIAAINKKAADELVKLEQEKRDAISKILEQEIIDIEESEKAKAELAEKSNKKYSEYLDLRIINEKNANEKRILQKAKIDSDLKKALELNGKDDQTADELRKKAADEKDKIDSDAKKERIKAVTDAVVEGINQQLEAYQKLTEAQIKQTKTLISAQEKKVAAAEKLAEGGNTALLKEEQKKLDTLNAMREKQLKRSMAIAQMEATINMVAAVAKSAAEGGALAWITIAGTIAAFVMGIAAAKAAVSGGFYEGGYTGDGNPKSESRKLGKKDYKYHKAEFVFDHEKTKENLDIFKKIHNNELDLKITYKKAMAMDEILNGSRDFIPNEDLKIIYVNQGSEKLEKKMDNLEKAIKSQPGFVLNFDERGIHGISSRINYRNKKLKSLAS